MITNEEWDAIEKKLEGWFSDVSFLYDGHSVRVKKLPVSENNLRLIVFIDGVIDPNKTIDLSGNGFCHLVCKFWRKSEKYAFDKKFRETLRHRNALLKGFRQKNALGDPDIKITSYHPDFSTAKILVRQFRRIDGLTFVQNTNNMRSE